jgi:pimeloyl-ACP methyl ester carboxylesterase
MNTAARHAAGDASAVRPFHVNVPEAQLADLRKRIEATRFPERETVDDFSQGVPSSTIQKLARYWASEYNWRKVEARLNAWPQFITQIGGVDIHFLHIRSKHENALPLLVSHGWPGSIIVHLKIIEPLTDPTAHGGSASDAFHLVIPSMPGYGFSGKPTSTGWDPPRIARAWATLMQRLGYTRYAAQGGDWGSLVVEQMAVQSPSGLLGIHTNMPAAVPPEIDAAAFTGAAAPADLPADESKAYDDLVFVYKHVYYAFLMGSRPQTLVGLADSPVFLASFMIDLSAQSLQLIARAFDGKREGLTQDDVLDSITFFWLTNTGVSAGRLYWENKLPYFAPKHVDMPVAVSVFPQELYTCPRSWAQRAYPTLIHFNIVLKGGHFAAWEQPEIFTTEVRNGLKSLRHFN